jgi:hypothetical protein
MNIDIRTKVIHQQQDIDERPDTLLSRSLINDPN